MRTVSFTVKDVNGRRGIFSFGVGDAYDDGTYTEIYALLDAIRAASECQIVAISMTKLLDLGDLSDNDPPSQAGEHSLVDDQAIMVFRAASGTETRVTVPGPLRTMFDAAGGFSDADVDEAGAPALAIIAAGQTEPLLCTRENATVQYKKGWRKGQHHS